MLTAANNSFSQASGGSAVPECPGIPEDFEVQQPKSRSAKKRRISGGQSGSQSGGQTIDEQADPIAPLAHVRKWMMENIRDRIGFNQITEEFCQMGEVAHVGSCSCGRQSLHPSPPKLP